MQKHTERGTEKRLNNCLLIVKKSPELFGNLGFFYYLYITIKTKTQWKQLLQYLS